MRLILADLPMIMEGFHRVQADKGRRPGAKTWYINRYAEIPAEWQKEFMEVERALGRTAGITIGEAFPLALNRPEWLSAEYADVELTDPALSVIYLGVNDSVQETLKSLGVSPERAEQVERLFNDFFDGAPGTRHDRMQELFVTNQYSY
jgi:hypothetical protein